MTINTGATGQMSYYSAANAISGTTDLYVSGSNIGIGTASPGALLTVGATSGAADYGRGQAIKSAR